jgi:hypothetical protein
LFLKLVSGAIRSIAISASAMVGGALVGFRMDTIDLLCGRPLLTEEIRIDFWHTKYQDVKLPVFSALPAATLS